MVRRALGTGARQARGGRGREHAPDREDVMKRVLATGDKVNYKNLKPNLQELDKIQSYLTQVISALSDKIDLESFFDDRFVKGL